MKRQIVFFLTVLLFRLPFSTFAQQKRVAFIVHGGGGVI
jgi:hypothetical protein